MSQKEHEARAMTWRKSSHSMGNGACVEVAATGGRVMVRDSVSPVTCQLQLSAQAWRRFVQRAGDGVISEHP